MLVKKSPICRACDGSGGLRAKYNRKFPDAAAVASKYCKNMVIWRDNPYNRRFVFGASKTVYPVFQGRGSSVRSYP
jgi:hypothetical protein